MPAGAAMLRDGPVRVAKETLHVPTFDWQVAAVVWSYHVRPWETRSGASSRTSVSYGSNAFGQRRRESGDVSSGPDTGQVA